MMFFGKKKEKDPSKHINYREIDLTDIPDPVIKAQTVLNAIVEDLEEHVGKAPMAIAMGLILNRLCNELDPIEPGFKNEMIEQMRKH